MIFTKGKKRLLLGVVLLLLIVTVVKFTIYDFTISELLPLQSCTKMATSNYLDQDNIYSVEKFHEKFPEDYSGKSIGSIDGRFIGYPQNSGYTFTIQSLGDYFENKSIYLFLSKPEATTWKAEGRFDDCSIPNMRVKRIYKTILIDAGFDQTDVQNNAIKIEKEISGFSPL
jgi:hypothetical protein